MQLTDLITKEGDPDLAGRVIADAASTQLIAFGEIHGQPNALQQVGRELMPALKGLGFSTLAIETPNNFGTLFERFNARLGNDQHLAALLAARQPAHGMPGEDPMSVKQLETDFFKMLLAARDNGIAVIPVDVPNLRAPNVRREPHMIESVTAIVKERGAAIFWGGVKHVTRRTTIDSRYKSTAEGVCENLGGQGVYSVAGIAKCSDYYQEWRPLLEKLPQPLYLRTQHQPTLAQALAFVNCCGPNGDNAPEDDKDIFEIRYGHFDALIVLPTPPTVAV